MKEDSVNWNSNDALVLATLPYETPGKKVSTENIIATCDYYNHAIISYDELSQALEKLSATGLLIRDENHFALTPSFYALFGKQKKFPRNVMKAIAAFEKMLTKESFEKSEAFQLTREEYDLALQHYLSRHQL